MFQNHKKCLKSPNLIKKQHKDVYECLRFVQPVLEIRASLKICFTPALESKSQGSIISTISTILIGENMCLLQNNTIYLIPLGQL